MESFWIEGSMIVKQPDFDLLTPPNQIPSVSSMKNLDYSSGAITWRISASNEGWRAIASS